MSALTGYSVTISDTRVTISGTRENCDQVFACDSFDDLADAMTRYNRLCKEVFGKAGGWGDIEHKAVTLWQEYDDGTSVSVAYTDKDEYEYTLASLRFFFGDDFNW